MTRLPLNPFRPTRWEHQQDGKQLIWYTRTANNLADDKSIYVSGSRGSGKTTLLRSICWEDLATNVSLRMQRKLEDFKSIGIYVRFPDHLTVAMSFVDWARIYPLSKQHAASASIANTPGSITSEGVWESLPVPFFESESTIPNHRDVLVALGGEVGLTLPFIEKYEPRRLGLIVISESEVQTPERLPKSEQYALNELQSEPNIERVNLSLCDVVGLARYAVEFSKRSSADAITALAIGSKTHALALGIAAFSQSRMEVICRIPKRYTMLDVESNGIVVGFEIEDRFEPNAYLT
jgi:hypothetical protein